MGVDVFSHLGQYGGVGVLIAAFAAITLIILSVLRTILRLSAQVSSALLGTAGKNAEIAAIVSELRKDTDRIDSRLDSHDAAIIEVKTRVENHEGRIINLEHDWEDGRNA